MARNRWICVRFVRNDDLCGVYPLLAFALYFCSVCVPKLTQAIDCYCRAQLYERSDFVGRKMAALVACKVRLWISFCPVWPSLPPSIPSHLAISLSFIPSLLICSSIPLITTPLCPVLTLFSARFLFRSSITSVDSVKPCTTLLAQRNSSTSLPSPNSSRLSLVRACFSPFFCVVLFAHFPIHSVASV